MLIIPYSLCTNDHRCKFTEQKKLILVFVASGAGVSKPDDWFELLKAEFDQLYSEGQNGTPKMMFVLALYDTDCQDNSHAQSIRRQAWSYHGVETIHGLYFW